MTANPAIQHVHWGWVEALVAPGTTAGGGMAAGNYW